LGLPVVVLRALMRARYEVPCKTEKEGGDIWKRKKCT